MGRSSGSGMRSAGAREALAWSLARPKRGREVEGLRHQGQGDPVCQRDGDRHRAWGVHRSAGWESSVRPLSERWLASRIVDPSTLIRYETALRLHVDPVFGCRQLSSVKPSEIASWLADLQCAVRPGDGAYGVRSAARHAGACRGRRHDQAQSGQGSSGVGTAVVVQSWPRLAPADPPHQNAGVGRQTLPRSYAAAHCSTRGQSADRRWHTDAESKRSGKLAGWGDC